MVEHRVGGFVAECYWPDVSEHAVRAVEERITACAAELDVRYLGSILLREDEVVLCQFEGTADAVHQVVVRAQVPFERLLEATTYRTKEGTCSTD